MDIRQKIKEANSEALDRMIAGDPVLADIAPAGEVIPGLEDKMILHSGPPVDWQQMSGAQKGACIGMVLFEGWARTKDEAVKLLESGEITLDCNHHHQAVGPMAGTITESTWVFVVKNRAFGNLAFCRQVESDQQFGNYSADAVQNLVMWRDVSAPALRAALHHMGGLPLKPIITRALQMGDELHNRPHAASKLFATAMTVPLIEAGVSKEKLIPTLYLLANHDLFFLGLAMAAGKCIADAARDVAYSTVVVAMARNGTEFGIQVSGLGNEWFTAPAPEVRGLFLPGYGPQDAGRDIGDSAITETVGWGGFVLAGAMGILSFVGGTPDEAFNYSRSMRQITVTQSPDYLIPALSFEGTALGIDVRKVVQTNILPIIDTAMAHKEPGHSIIGAGLVNPPIECFKKALARFASVYGLN
jgi:hypothetical protein